MGTNQFEVDGPAAFDKGKNQRGVALLLVLLVLLLMSAIGLGLMYMSNTETSINSNYRDSQVAFFGMRAGLEEVRDRMRTNSIAPLALPTVMPGAPGSILYVINPANAADVVSPAAAGNKYFDDEFCHDNFTGPSMPLPNPGTNVPCTVGPPAGSFTYVNSFLPTASPTTITAAGVPYKWARITLKQNATITGNAGPIKVDAAVDSAQACFQTLENQEISSTLLPGGPYASCAAANAAGQDVGPVYLVTSLAVTLQGSRRIGQYEVVGLKITPPPAALGLDGPAATFSPRPASDRWFANGFDSGAAGYTASGGTGACVPSGPAAVPAVGTADAAGVTNIDKAITKTPDRSPEYTGLGGTPSVVNQGPTGTNQWGGGWSTPSEMDGLVNDLANVADVTYNCAIGAPCSPSGTVGTNANPQITFVNGDFNYGSTSGAGVLIVTGTLNLSGNASFNGLILVIGQGVISELGGGNANFNGTIFMAKTHSSTSPYPELVTLGTPVFSWNGGGTANVQYNSCWANIGNQLHYMVVATREEMY